MSTTKLNDQAERPQDAIRPVFSDFPYRAVVFADFDGNNVPLFLVAGSAAAPCGAEVALRAAHKLHGGQCYLCGKPIGAANLSIDHIEPKAANGSDAIQNLAIAHKKCNQLKGHLPIDAYQPNAGRDWLLALHRQIEQRLAALNQPSPPQPKPDAAAGP